MAVLIAAIGGATGLFLREYRPDYLTDHAAARQAAAVASDGAVALLSYSPETLNHDLQNAKSRLTGDFLAYYNNLAEQVVAPTTQRGQVTSTARVIRAAVSALRPDSAEVLVFVDQTTTTKDKPGPVKTGFSVQIALIRVSGSWLITKFEAV